MDGAEVIASLVKFSSHIEEIFFDDNLIGNEGVEFLAEAVVCCRTLRLLSLSHNNISEPGIESLCHSLVHNMALKDLRLLHNPLGRCTSKYTIQPLSSLSLYHTIITLLLYNPSII